jgi:hypothetical protein
VGGLLDGCEAGAASEVHAPSASVTANPSAATVVVLLSGGSLKKLRHEPPPTHSMNKSSPQSSSL